MIKYREEWLNEGLLLLKKQVFAPCKYALAADIRVSCGFPSSKAFSQRQPTIGQCWYPQSNGSHELFISPTIADSVFVLGTLTHEIVHTLTAKGVGHTGPFRYIAKRVGLTGKMTATVAGPKLTEALQRFVKSLGPYPHKPITGQVRARKPALRLVAGGCNYCGYVVKVPPQWVDESGLPLCPACQTQMTPNGGLAAAQASGDILRFRRKI